MKTNRKDRSSVASGILCVAADTKRLCLAWRSPEIPQGNCWGMIGGMTKEGMTPEEGALCELGEEVGYHGPITLHAAFVRVVPGFRYHNYIGIVPGEFPFDPEPEFAWETSFIEWLPYSHVNHLIQNQPKQFHPGMLQLFCESRVLIEGFVS